MDNVHKQYYARVKGCEKLDNKKNASSYCGRAEEQGV